MSTVCERETREEEIGRWGKRRLVCARERDPGVGKGGGGSLVCLCTRVQAGRRSGVRAFQLRG